ncbi:MAG TPA: hypothetical protein VF941_09345 [Clostridia bacterium]
MKKILIITTHRKLICLSLCFILPALVMLAILFAYFNKCSMVSNNQITPLELEKENSRLNKLISSITPEEQKDFFEDERRNMITTNTQVPSSPLPVSPLGKVISHGTDIKFRVLYDDTKYLRPLYDPSWKDTYYRSWLFLPHKNLEARHNIFAYSLGASANYDIFGSLGFDPNVPLDNHHNINFLVYGFEVQGIKAYENQVALIGEPKQAGAQIISIVQNDLLPEGVNTKDFVFQLSTPKGYEIDYLSHSIIRYEYLMDKIKESTVGAFHAIDQDKGSLSEELLSKNTALKKELSYYIPLKDEIIPKQSYKTTDSIHAILKSGHKIPFHTNFKGSMYKWPLYSPSWKENYKRSWCYVPKQIEYNLHRLLIIPQSKEKQQDFFGMLGFHEKYEHIKSNQYGFMIYRFNVSGAIAYKNQVLFIGTPSRTGAQIVSIDRNSIDGYTEYIIQLVTPDNFEIDSNVCTCPFSS